MNLSSLPIHPLKPLRTNTAELPSSRPSGKTTENHMKYEYFATSSDLTKDIADYYNEINSIVPETMNRSSNVWVISKFSREFKK